MEKEYYLKRPEYEAILAKRILGVKEGYRQNIALLGEEGTGKTTLLFEFLKNFQDNRVVPIYIDVKPESLESFGKRFIGILLYNFLVNSQEPLKEDIEFLIGKSSPFIPKTCEKIKLLMPLLSKKNKDQLFPELLSLCDSFYQETSKSCVVIFDEFQNLESLGVKKLYKSWAKQLMASKNTLYIITSSLKHKALNILSKDLSLLFGNFEIINFEPFDIRHSEQFLHDLCEDSSAVVALEANKNFIINFTGGYPFYLKVIVDELRRSPTGAMTDILEQLLFAPSGSFNLAFSGLVERLKTSEDINYFLRILIEVSNGRNRIKDIAHALKITKKDLDGKVQYLLENQIISKSADFLKITDRVFGFWLKFVYQGKLQSLTFDARNQQSRFREHIESALKEFNQQSQAPIAERMIEMLRLFSDDQVQIERKKLKLNQFREIKPLQLHTKNIKEGLLCRSAESLWIIALNYHILTEEDITEFARECKKYKNKLQKKILINFQGLDQNSRLRALEEKITTWDIHNVNELLDLYSKPMIIA